LEKSWVHHENPWDSIGKMLVTGLMGFNGNSREKHVGLSI
jgi:hypothetical protein